jgi:hypothetical protein
MGQWTSTPVEMWPVVDVDGHSGGEVSVEGHFLNDVEPEVSARHAIIEENRADEPML